MLDPIILDPEQERDAQRIAVEASGAALDASTLSAGKTPVAVRVCQLRDAKVILVTGPLNTRSGWKSTFERMGVDLPFHWIRNNVGGRSALTLLQFSEPGIYFIGPEYATLMNWDVVRNSDGEPIRSVSTGKLIKRKNDIWANIHPDIFIIDEIHRGTSNSSSQRYKVFLGMRAGFKLALSGTPHGNEFQGIYPVTKVLWPDLVPASNGAFLKQYVAMTYDPWPKFSGVGDFKRFKRKWCREGTCTDETHLHGEPGNELVPGAYFASLPCVVRRVWEYEGTIDERDVLVELSPTQRRAYDELQKNMVTYLTGNPLVIELPPTLRIRLRQATLGMFHVTDEDTIEFADDCESSKLDELRKVLQDDFQHESALIFTDSARFGKVVEKRLGDLGTTQFWGGSVSSIRRDEIKQQFISGDIKYVVMVIKSGGTGTDGLQFGTRNVAWLSVDDSRVENIQALGRDVRRGQGDLVRIRNIIAVDTYDQGILSDQMKATLDMNESMRLEAK